MMLGILLFVLIMSFRLPLLSEQNSFVDSARIYNNFGFLLYSNTMVLYFICSAWMCGLMGGLFALLSAYLSLYERNRMFTICAPVIGVYFIDNFLTGTLHLPNEAKILAIFDSDKALFETRWMNIAYAAVVALVAFVVIGTLTERLREKYMGERMRRALVNSVQNIKNRLYSFRFFTVAFMLVFILDLYLGDFRNNIHTMGVRANMAVLPFLQTSNFFMKLVLLCVVYFYSDAPFMEKDQLFSLMRLGKVRWGRRNLSYIVGSAFVLSGLLTVLSILEILPVGKFSTTWDAAYKTLSLTGGDGLLGFAVEYQIMKNYSPAELMLLTFAVDGMVFAVVGMVMYALSLMGCRTLAAATGVLITFLPSIDNQISVSLVYFSPSSWLDCENWRVGYDNTIPDLAYILVALCFSIFLLGVLCQARVKHMEWKATDN